MGFLDFVSETGLSVLDTWLLKRSYIVGYGPSQADVACFKTLKEAPAPAKYPHAHRWYKHIASHEAEFSTLPGDPTKAYSTYGPESSELTLNPAKAPEKAKAAPAEDDDDIDLFGSSDEEENAEAEKLKQERLDAYHKKKAGKVKPAAKSVCTLDIKPWDDETDLVEMERLVRSIGKDGLLWGKSTLVEIGYGIKKLQMNLVIEDEKVSLDDIQEQIAGFEDHVQSTDVVAMQKL
ncbi:MAG: Translation elongation factor 1 beta [Trizodia sp. TS-e1964]|nr:MAG: Translation elongation factor 1 beta [Trizodia sp. TS-e1964]